MPAGLGTQPCRVARPPADSVLLLLVLPLPLPLLLIPPCAGLYMLPPQPDLSCHICNAWLCPPRPSAPALIPLFIGPMPHSFLHPPTQPLLSHTRPPARPPRRLVALPRLQLFRLDFSDLFARPTPSAWSAVLAYTLVMVRPAWVDDSLAHYVMIDELKNDP